MADFTETIYSLFLYFRLIILKLSLYFQQQVFYKLVAPSIRAKTQTILFIGDGNAIGIGDRLGHTGTLGLLRQHITRNYTQEQYNKLKLQWRVVTDGKLYSTSKDWLPGTPYFRDALNKYNPKIVIILLGSNSEHENESYKDLIENFKRICDSLLDDERMVIVPGLPNYYNEPGCYQANVDLKTMLSQLNANRPSTDFIVLDNGRADLTKISSLGNDAITKESTFCTLNARGHRLFAADLFEDVLTMAKKVEWKHWKQQLTKPNDDDQSSASSMSSSTTS